LESLSNATFQNVINKVAGNNVLKFTATIWDEGSTEPKKSLCKRLEVCNSATFSLLDVELCWSDTGHLKIGVHLKENQELKYLNIESTHSPACFKAISTGVFHRLAKLTSCTEENKNTLLSDLYPDHFAALKVAVLM
jgi:hypothetical protein